MECTVCVVTHQHHRLLYSLGGTSVDAEENRFAGLREGGKPYSN